jgi:hypothetical protein
MTKVLSRLSDSDSDVRYAAFREADALDDDSLFLLISDCFVEPLRCAHPRTLAAAARISVVFSCVVALWHIHPVIAVAAMPAAWFLGRPTGRFIAKRRPFLHAALARIMSRRRDPRLIDACARIAAQHEDAEVGNYAAAGLTQLLPLAGLAQRDIVARHEPLLTGILVRPLEDVALTKAILAAFAAVGSSRTVKTVRRLAGAPQTGEVLARALLQREHEERETDVRRCVEDEMKRDRQIFSTETSHVPDIFLLKGEEVSEFGFNVSLRAQEELAAQVREIACEAGRCVELMEARLSRERLATSLLHPASRPQSDSEVLLRAARSGGAETRELLRPQPYPMRTSNIARFK